MRIATRLVLFVALAAVVPLALVTVAVVNVTERAVTEAILRAEVSTAQGVADSVATHLGDVTQALRLQLANFRLEVATDEARQAFAIATWRAHPTLAALALTDAGGAELVAPVHAGSAGGGRTGTERSALTATEVDAFRSAVPGTSTPGEVAFGVARGPRLPLALASPRGEGVVLVAELTLEALRGRLAAFGGGHRAVALCDDNGRILIHAGDPSLLETDRLRSMLQSSSADYRYTTEGGVAVLGASARVPPVDGVDLRWSVVVAEPAVQVGFTAEAIRGRAAYIGGAATVFAVLAGVLFSGSLTEPIRRLRTAANAFGGGDFTHRVRVDGGGELAELGAAFNAMSVALEESRSAVERFNEELQARVDERTAALRATQADLVRAGRLAAAAELSGGLAHELNNPLAAFLGAVQVARSRGAGDPMLEVAEREALRCRTLVTELLRLTQATDDDPVAPVDLAAVAAEALALSRPALAARGLRDRSELAPVHVLASRGALLHGVAQLIAAARDICSAAAGDDEDLRVTVATDASWATLSVAARSVRADVDGWRAAGLGGWMARQLLAPADVVVPSVPEPHGGATVWSVRLPRVDAPSGGQP
jgi:signal transduction histidine kinase